MSAAVELLERLKPAFRSPKLFSRNKAAKGFTFSTSRGSWPQAINSLCSSTAGPVTLFLLRPLPRFLSDFVRSKARGVSTVLVSSARRTVLTWRPVSSATNSTSVSMPRAVLCLQFRKRNFRFLVAGAGESQNNLTSALCCVVQETFVDMADLLNTERAERKPACLGGSSARNSHAEDLQRLKQVEHDAVIDFERRCRDRPPSRVRCTTFEKRVTVGIEQRAAIRWQSHRFVLYAAVYRAKSSKSRHQASWRRSKISSPC